MNAMQFVNEPVEFKLGARTVLLKRLGTIRKMAIAQADILNRLVAEVTEKAKAVEDKDRTAYTFGELSKLPSGKDLHDQTLAALDAADVSLICKLFCAMWVTDPEPSADDAEHLLNDASKEEVDAVLWFMRAGKKNLNSPTPTSGSSSAM